MPVSRAKRFRSVKQRAVLGFGPRLDRALIQGQGFVRNHEIQIEVNGVSESLTPRAGAVWVVEREQSRFRFLVANIADFAFEALGETQLFGSLSFARSGFEDDFTGLAITDLNRIHDAGPGVRRYH